MLRAGIVSVKFHGLPRTHFTNVLRSNVRQKIATERTRHESEAITMGTHSHVLPGLQEDTAEQIDAVLRPDIPE